ncbi:hypothetical protein OROMI_020179 [Orobanche minor]
MDLFFESDSYSSSSDDEEVELAIIAGEAILEKLTTERNSTPSYGSIRGRISKNRNHIEGHKGLFRDYFADPPSYPANDFRRRFRMNRDLFLRIKDAVVAHDSYFLQKRNAAGKLGLSSFQKITAAFRILAFGVTGDLFDEYIRIGESTATESVKRFVKAIVYIFGDEYLRRPNKDDTIRLLAEGKKRGFPGMLGSIDCMEWEWKNCPTRWSGMYTGRSGKPTIKLEAIASSDTWIWHAFFGLPGSHNEINVLERSPLLNELVDGQATPVNFSINGHDYNKGYYLADGIYPTWATFVKTIPVPIGLKRQYFAKVHEALRKDVERAFGILQSRFAIIRGPARYYNQDDLKHIMTVCVIMHNMIVEDERHMYLNAAHVEYDQDLQSPPNPEIYTTKMDEDKDFIARHIEMRDSAIHTQLQDDLIEHLWKIYSES